MLAPGGPKIYRLAGGTLEEGLRAENGEFTRLRSMEFPAVLLAPSEEMARPARGVKGAGRSPMYGAPEAVKLQDDPDAEAWAMIWVEALPPPHAWPRGKPYQRRKSGQKNGCGGRGIESRSLADPGVEKWIHITRLHGLKIVDDRVVSFSNCFDARRERLRVRADERGVEVNGVVHGRDGRVIEKKSFEPLPRVNPLRSRPARQELRAIGYDETSQRGLMLISDGQNCWSQGFDPSGEPAGEPAWVADSCLGFAPGARLVLAGGRWCGLASPHPRGSSESDLDGRAEIDDDRPDGATALVCAVGGQLRPFTARDVVALAPDPQGGLLALSRVSDGPGGLRVTWLGAGGEPGSESLLSMDGYTARGAFVWHLDGLRSTILVGARGPRPEVFQLSLDGAGGWRLAESFSEGIQSPESTLDFLDVPGDLVALARRDVALEARWIGAGERRSFAENPGRFPPAAPLKGPLLSLASGWAVLPPSPGPLTPVRGLDEVLPQSCVHSIHTSGSTLLLVCNEQTPGRRGQWVTSRRLVR